MIIFDLVCENGHPFEGWFRSPRDFEEQLEDGLLSCPVCGLSEIRRVPSVINVGRIEPEAKEQNVSTRSSNTPQFSMRIVDSPASALAAMQELISIITSQCENVGTEFAREARKIHYAEAPDRPIRGEVSKEEFDELHDEGIDVMLLPRLKNSNLM